MFIGKSATGAPFRRRLQNYVSPRGLFLLLFFKTDGITAGLYTVGFTSASLEEALLLAIRSISGA
jgi:hypothetical protein